MTTYACYFIWVGVRNDRLEEVDKDNPFITRLFYDAEAVNYDGLRFERIYMHGDLVGSGVKVLELDWLPASKGPGEYDPTLTKSALDMCEKVCQIFRENKITTDVKIYHHIDLGG